MTAPKPNELKICAAFCGSIFPAAATPTNVATSDKITNNPVGTIMRTENKILHQYWLRLDVPVKSPPRRKRFLTAAPKPTPTVLGECGWTGKGFTSCSRLGNTKIIKVTSAATIGRMNNGNSPMPLAAISGPAKATITNTRYNQGLTLASRNRRIVRLSWG